MDGYAEAIAILHATGLHVLADLVADDRELDIISDEMDGRVA